MAANGKMVPEDLSPSLLKLGVLPDGYIIHNVTGIRTQIVRRLDGNGYDIRKRKKFVALNVSPIFIISLVGHYAVRSGHTVYINDSSIFHRVGEDSKIAQTDLRRRQPELSLHFFTSMDPTFSTQTGLLEPSGLNILTTGYAGLFGADLTPAALGSEDNLPRFSHGEGLSVFREPSNSYGCSPYDHSYPDYVMVVERGGCTFLEKLIQARDASAAGILVISDEDVPINPTANIDELEVAGDLSDSAIVLLPRKVGAILLAAVASAEDHGATRVIMALHREQERANADTGHLPERLGEKVKDSNRILYINGHPLLNTRLLV